MSTNQGTQQKPMEIIIEFCAEHNNNFLFVPTQRVHRGRYDRHKLPAGTTSRRMGAMKIDGWPGMYACLDVESHHARIIDPLNLPQYEGQIEKISAVMRSANLAKGATEVIADEDRDYPRLTPGGVKTWVFWMRRFVQDGQATLIQGKFPSEAAVDKWPGRTLVNPMEMSHGVPKYLEDMPERAPLEPLQEEVAGAGG